MEALSSAAYVTRSPENAQLDNPGKACLLAESVFAEPEPSLELECLSSEQFSNDALVPLAAPFETAEPSLIARESSTSQWKVFSSTFITIFLAELGDKTQVATLLMSAESHAPWIVFTGAAAALVTTSLLGVLVGQWLSSRVSPTTLDRAAGIMLALISVWLLLDVMKM